MWRQMKVLNSFTLEATFSGTVLDRSESVSSYNCLTLLYNINILILLISASFSDNSHVRKGFEP